jgi:hypothetical protein
VSEPLIPPHWPKDEPFPWPEWEAACPSCGRFHHHWHLVSGEMCRCAHCGWMGHLNLLRADSQEDKT